MIQYDPGRTPVYWVSSVIMSLRISSSPIEDVGDRTNGKARGSTLLETRTEYACLRGRSICWCSLQLEEREMSRS